MESGQKSISVNLRSSAVGLFFLRSLCSLRLFRFFSSRPLRPLREAPSFFLFALRVALSGTKFGSI